MNPSIYTLEKTVHQPTATDAESRPLIRGDDPQTVFTRALDFELEKISSFYQIKEKEILDDAEALLRDVGAFEEDNDAYPRPATAQHSADHIRQVARGRGSRSARSTEDGDEDSDSGDDGDDDETAALTKKRRRSSPWAPPRRKAPSSAMYNSTDLGASTELGRSARRSSAAGFDDFTEMESSSIMIKKRIIGHYVQLCELKSYVQLNHTGFRKVLKKFDKIVDMELRAKYMSNFVDPAYPFRRETMKNLDEKITAVEQAYADIVTQGDLERAKRDLRSHLREHVVWERNTVWRELIGLERRAEAASLGRGLLGAPNDGMRTRLQGDDVVLSPTQQIKTPLGRFTCPTWVLGQPMLTLLLIIVTFLVLLFVPIMDLPEQQNCLAMLVFVSLLWATEAIPLFVTALLIPFLCVLLNIPRSDDGHERLGSKDATNYIFASMWTPVIMLLLGGFTIAAALSKMKIDKRIATFVLSKAGTRPRTVVLANMFVAAFASMLVSNVAAPVLCFSIIEVR